MKGKSVADEEMPSPDERLKQSSNKKRTKEERKEGRNERPKTCREIGGMFRKARREMNNESCSVRVAGDGRAAMGEN